MKVFVINMTSATDRLAFMKEQLERYQVEFERFPAVVGRDLPDGVVKGVSSAFLQWCARGRVLHRGEIGCALSHIKVWERVVREELPCACILEDDVTVLNNIKRHLEELEHRIDREVNEVYLLSAGSDSGSKFEVCQVLGDTYACCGYVVTYRSAKFLIECNTPIVYPCDTWNVWCKWGLTLWKCNPRSVAHWNRKQFGSMADDYNKCDKSPIFRIVNKMKRCIGYPIVMVYRQYRMFKFWLLN